MSSSLRPWVAPVALVALVALVRGWDAGARTVVVSVNNGGEWGEWGEAEFCPKGSYATGFQLKLEPRKGFFGDDTALNGIRLLCPGGTATSSEGPRGAWSTPQACSRSRYLVSFRLRVEPPRGLWDDTAANDLDATCSDGTVLEGQGGVAGLWGNWSDPCPPGWGVCGLRTRVEPPQRGGDDTGLNSAELYCCS